MTETARALAEPPPPQAAPTPGPAPAAPARLEDLRPWQRFSVRLAALYGLVVFAVLSAMAVVFYRRGAAAETEVLQARIQGMAVALAESLDERGLEALASPEAAGSPAHRAMVERFAAIGARDLEVASIYALRDTGEAGLLRFAADWVRRGEAALPGRPYRLDRAPTMREGLRAPAVEQEPFTDEWGATLSGYAPIVRGGRVLGLVGVDVTAARLAQVRGEALVVTLVFYGVAAVLLLAMAGAVGRSVATVLGRIVGATGAIASGRFDARVGIDRDDELGLLGRQFDRMASGLQERDFLRETFGRYVSRDVAAKLLSSQEGAGPGGEVREVTVLVSDLKGYSTICEHLDPPQMVRVLNAYLGAMGDLIEAHGGCVIEFLGDGILCVFGAPSDLPAHPEQALRCALAMRSRLAQLNREFDRDGLSRIWKERGLPDLAARVGIHTGTVVAGNLGSRSRMKYTAIGEPVNVATRCEGLNKKLGTTVVCTRQTFDRLPPDLRALGSSRGEHAVRGGEQTAEVFAF